MTVPVLRIKVLPKPTIRGKMDVRFPASVSGRIGVVLEKIAGHYYFDIDYSQFGEIATIPDYLEQTTYFLTWESGANAFSRISVTSLKADITATFDNQYQPLDPTLTALAGLDATPGLLVQTGEDIFARRSLVAPASGLTITNPAGTAADPTFALSNDLAAVEALSGTGLARRTGADAWSVGTTVAVNEGGTGATTAAGARTNLGLVPGTNVQAWDADLDAVAGLSSTGIIARTGAGTAATRAITAPAAGVTVSNGDGVAGNPTLALANDLAALEGLGGTGIARRTGTDAWSTGTAVANAELAAMTTGTIKGNVSGSTATPSDLTATQVTATLNAMVGDSGSGGTKGLVPAPGPNDAANEKYLKADGTWQIPSGGGGGGTGASDYDYLINGDGQINQAVAGAGIADGFYGHDQWVALTQTGTIAVATLTDVEDGLPNMIRLTQSQATAQRMGYLQPLEASRIKRLRGNLVTMVMRLRNSTGAAIRYAIVEHTGTADTLTKDIVNDWTSGTYTTGNFFAAQSGNITVRAVGAITPSANTLTDATLSATLGSTLNNLYVFVWTEGTAAQNSTLDLAVNLRRGNASAPIVMRPFDAELIAAQRYYWKTYNYGTAPGSVLSTGSASILMHSGGNGTSLRYSLRFPARMRAVPTCVVYDEAGNANKFTVYNMGTAQFENNKSVSAVSIKDFYIYVIGDIANSAQYGFELVANARL